MLKNTILKLNNRNWYNILQKILDSKFLIILIALLTLMSNLFSLEIICLYCYLFIVIIAILFSDDLLCLLPIACCGYYTFSRKNNPLSNSMTSVFLEKTTITHLIIILIATAVFAITRLIFDLITKEEKRKLPKLTWGFLALGLTYILGGLLSKYYDSKTAFFGFTQIAALSFCYFYFYFTIDFKKVNKSYFAFLVTVISILLLAESIGMLYYCNFFSKDVFYRHDLYTGWGINNNVAACICMTFVGPFYYACKKKYGWLFLILCNLLFICLVFIQSRNGILCGLILFTILFFLAIAKASNSNRPHLILTQIFLTFCYVTVIILFEDFLYSKLVSIINVGLSDSGRFQIYIDGFKQFLDYPILGNGFYQCNTFRWGNNDIGSFFPARYHNTYIQILASCGLVSMIAYLFHRFQTVKLVFKKGNCEKYFMSVIIFSLILTSILDCNFFNFGPGFLYSTILLLLEINSINNKILKD